jgi:microcystin-dependent protein
LQAHAGGGTQAAPTGHLLAASDQRNSQYSNVTVADATMASTAIGNTGSSTGHSNLQPALALHYIIATQGIYPSRN